MFVAQGAPFFQGVGEAVSLQRRSSTAATLGTFKVGKSDAVFEFLLSFWAAFWALSFKGSLRFFHVTTSDVRIDSPVETLNPRRIGGSKPPSFSLNRMPSPNHRTTVLGRIKAPCAKRGGFAGLEPACAGRFHYAQAFRVRSHRIKSSSGRLRSIGRRFSRRRSGRRLIRRWLWIERRKAPTG